jgi:hypothetical protein
MMLRQSIAIYLDVRPSFFRRSLFPHVVKLTSLLRYIKRALRYTTFSLLQRTQLRVFDTKRHDAAWTKTDEDRAEKVSIQIGSHGSSLTRKRRLDMAASDPIPLPVEIWSQILFQFKNLTLWVDCR